MSAKDATMNAKDATRSAKDGTHKTKDATMSAKDATMSANGCDHQEPTIKNKNKKETKKTNNDKNINDKLKM